MIFYTYSLYATQQRKTNHFFNESVDQLIFHLFHKSKIRNEPLTFPEFMQDDRSFESNHNTIS